VRFSQLDGARVGVWGAGREIRSFAVQLSRRLPSARIVAAAFDRPPAADELAGLAAPDARVLVGERVAEGLRECDVLVRSPGVSIHRPEIEALRAAGVAVTTATALWLAERAGERTIGVSGTKGKSTTAALACHLARATGSQAALAGNIGAPALDLLDRELDLAVVELSSYQIADLEVGPEVAVMTNLYREHLDWHGSEEAYRTEKLRLLGLPGVRAAVVNARQGALLQAVPAGVQRVDFGLAGEGWDAREDGLWRAGERILAAGELPLPGQHNALNLCAALTALEAFGLAPPPLPDALAGFRALPHRLERVACRDGVLWVNDSISTTPESTLAALASFPERELVLIGGGQDRGQDYTELGRELASRGAHVIGVPTTGPRLLAAARAGGLPQARAHECAGLEEAVLRAGTLAREGAVVLLSPAAPSYDRYASFEERGERFRALAACG
jgi:UDP-N-acetylmuramoylalanine--D-glutamate ligase